MKVIGIKVIKRDKLTLPGNWGAVLQRGSAAQRGKSYAENGWYLHEPIVRKLDGKLVLLAGRDRIAGLELQGIDDATVKIVECSDEEASSIEEVENIERRHDPLEQQNLIAKRIRRLEQALATDGEPQPRRRGRPKSLRSKAIELVAAERGVKPRSVEQAERRRLEKVGAQAVEEFLDTPDEEVGPPIRLIGVVLDPRDMADLTRIQAIIDEAARHMLLAARSLGRLAGAVPFPESVLDRIRDAVRSAAKNVRDARPTVLCPYCKMIDGIQQDCAACHTKGWLGSVDGLQIPPELWDENDPIVIHKGETKHVSDLFGEQDPFA